MAINPNTNFTAGQVLTADQTNRFPRGVMAYGFATSTIAGFTAETVTLSAVTFTAVANRYYEIIYYEPKVFRNAGAEITQRIRLTNISGTVQQQSTLSGAANLFDFMTTSVIKTFSSGSVSLVGTLQTSTGLIEPNRSATIVAYLLVKDIGPA
jgi:hypothetical protein